MAALLALPVMAPAVAAETGLAPAALGAYSFLMWTAAMLASGPIGRLIARYGALRMVQTSLVLVALALLGAATGAFAGLVIAPLLIGIACAMETPRALTCWLG